MPLSCPKPAALQRGLGHSQTLAGRAAPRRVGGARPAPLPVLAAASYAGAGGWEGRTQPTVGWQSSGEDQAGRTSAADYRKRWAEAMQDTRRRQQTQGSLQSWDTAPGHQHAQSGDHHHHQQHQQHHDNHHPHQPPPQAGHAEPLGDTGAGAGAGAGSSSVVEFKLKFATEYGQSLKIVGSAPALGSWDLGQAPAMLWSEGNVWRTVVELSQPSVAEYKYVLVDEGGGATWQQGSNNVLAVQAEQCRLELTDNWDGSAGTLVVGDGPSTSESAALSRDAQLLSRTNEIEAMMVSTRNQVRQFRVELDTANEEVKVARMQVAHVKSELQMEKQTSNRQALEIKLLKEENYELKTKLTESNAGFKSALETARMLLAQIEETGGTLPPLPDMPMPQVVARANA